MRIRGKRGGIATNCRLGHEKRFESASGGGGLAVRGLEDADDSAEALAKNGGAAHAAGWEGLVVFKDDLVLIAARKSQDGGGDFFLLIEDINTVADLDVGIFEVGKGVGRGEGFRVELEHEEVFLTVNGFSDDDGAFLAFSKQLGGGGASALVDGAGEVGFTLVVEVEKGAREGKVMDCLIGWHADGLTCFCFGTRGEEDQSGEEGEELRHGGTVAQDVGLRN